MQHLMIDLETLGTRADSIILSIGAVKFGLESGEIDNNGFYGSIDIESNLDAGRRMEEDTLLWWLKQPAAAQQVFHEDKLPLEQILTDLSDWLGHDDWLVWAKGPNFDTAILEHAYKSFGMTVPWKFWNTRCVRTYQGLPGAKNIRVDPVGMKHNALSDAFQQAQTIQRIHAALFAGATNSMVKTKVK